jgi:hypothetical protein
MDTQEDQQGGHSWSTRLYKGAILLVCLCIVAALCHLNLLKMESYRASYDDFLGHEEVMHLYVGWPVIFVVNESISTIPGPPKVVGMRIGALLADLFLAAVLVAATARVLRLRQSRDGRKWQFTLADLFSLTTAVAVLFAILASERTYGWTRLADASEEGVYSALSAYPWYDQVPIGIGIVCAVHLMLAALRQLLRSLVRPRSP